MSKEFWKAALIRALRTVAQNLASTIPAGLIITADMIANADWLKVFYVVLGWLATGLLGGVNSILTSIYTGLPEVPEIPEVKEE